MDTKQKPNEKFIEKPLKIEENNRRKPYDSERLPSQNMNMLKTLRGVRK